MCSSSAGQDIQRSLVVAIFLGGEGPWNIFFGTQYYSETMPRVL